MKRIVAICYIVYLILQVGRHGSVSIKFTRFDEMALRGYKCRDENIAFVLKNAVRKTDCLVKCWSIPDCLSVFYHEESRRCTGCKSFIGENDTAQDTSKFYRGPVSGQYRYVGCYADSDSKRIQEEAKYYDADHMTTEICVEWCRIQQFAFAMTEWQQECWCGNNPDVSERKVPDAECSDACTGNPNEICGGPSRGSLYRTSP